MDVPELKRPEIEYPDSDGEPMAETDDHRDILIATIETLKLHYGDRPDVYVSGDLLTYWIEGDPRSSVAPDIFVVLGVPSHNRRTYKVWEEGKAPDVVIELTSKETRTRDRRDKPRIYDAMGVREYFLYDPLEDYLRPCLQGFVRAAEGFAPMAPARREDAGLVLRSAVLGLDLIGGDRELRLRDTASGELLPTPRERADAEARHAVGATRRAAQAEAEAARLRAELDALRRGDA